MRKKNQGIQDDYANTWDLGTLSERERVAYLRGIWVGWQRAMGSQSNFGPGDGNLLCSFLAASLKEVEMPDEVKLKCYAAGRRLAIDYLPKPRSATFGGEQAPDREEEAA